MDVAMLAQFCKGVVQTSQQMVYRGCVCGNSGMWMSKRSKFRVRIIISDANACVFIRMTAYF